MLISMILHAAPFSSKIAEQQQAAHHGAARIIKSMEELWRRANAPTDSHARWLRPPQNRIAGPLGVRFPDALQLRWCEAMSRRAAKDRPA